MSLTADTFCSKEVPCLELGVGTFQNNQRNLQLKRAHNIVPICANISTLPKLRILQLRILVPSDEGLLPLALGIVSLLVIVIISGSISWLIGPVVGTAPVSLSGP